MARTSKSPSLGEFELLVLLSTLSLGEAAYPFAIGRDIETRTRRKAARGAVLITLERLEDKDFVSSWYGDPTPDRGGRPKRFFRVKPKGVRAVQESLDRIGTMATGLERLLERS
jgi:DNA-binding PadR family transcriptional regulator